MRANVDRRHLTTSQKAAIAVEWEESYAKETKVGRPKKLSQDCENIIPLRKPIHAAKEAARLMGISATYVTGAKRVLGPPK
jgi:hypothetical protein